MTAVFVVAVEAVALTVGADSEQRSGLGGSWELRQQYWRKRRQWRQEE